MTYGDGGGRRSECEVSGHARINVGVVTGIGHMAFERGGVFEEGGVLNWVVVKFFSVGNKAA